MGKSALTLPKNLTVESLRAQVRAEHVRRARLGLLDYARFVEPDYQTPWHIVQLAEALEAVERGDITRLMVSEPPRHGKSKLISQMFPCWCLGRTPTRQIVQSGYASDITLEHSRRARDIFAHEHTMAVFPEAKHRPGRRGQEPIMVERQAAGEWGTIAGGRYRAVGVGGGITGFGADIAIIDDPVKNREEAESPTVSQRVWDWYRSTLYTRLSPQGAIILVMTRWHPQDLAGRLLDEEANGGDQWYKIVLPASCEKYDALWPERFDAKKLADIEAAIGSREYAALYQQQPTIRGGNMFCTGNIVWHDSAADYPDCPYVRFWDLASTEKERAKDDPDYTVGALVGVTHTENGLPELWVKDIERMQEEAPKRDAAILATSEMDGPAVGIAIESVAGYKDAYTTLSGILHGQRSVAKVTVSKDKVVRATPIEPIFEAGNVHMIRGSWASAARTEFAEFPRGAHDDIVDAVAGAYEHIRKSLIDMVSFGALRRAVGV